MKQQQDNSNRDNDDNNDKILIENKYASLLTLIDTIYPPLLCTLCDAVFTSKHASNHHFAEKHKKRPRYICIHPYCDRRFLSKCALRFHISRSHLVIQAKKPLPDPSFIQYESIQPDPVEDIEKPVLKKKKETPPKQHKKPPTKKLTRKVMIPPLSSDELSTPSPPPSPFALYHHHHKRNANKRPTLSVKAEQFLNSIYPPLQCPSCNQVFARKTNVIKHLAEAHIGQEPYRCIYPSCNHPRLYATREGLVYHIVHVHDTQK
ncbi:uncharacterized protein B0P05DRAFT_60844 [Gilbertella persicaria]|uniref:C2H2-type domain-containing protein n=1 Tax=Rhizopus stolonifer TaxID=4846 RepID=A0A367KL92_RHIST|nr:uncharacterized protein B0P05DRAFT_60844 [Gilbertella persicaria]KAI8082657.1 hypothetical protein B0P05DRAFT_60844 [Gilbertella persicaria]RCI02966.1 hypothetical protein CU098_002483 [Rhizopus stolonifer]